MASKNDENFIAFCDELRAYVEEHKLFPQKHSRLSHKIKYTRKKINEGTLEDGSARCLRRLPILVTCLYPYRRKTQKDRR